MCVMIPNLMAKQPIKTKIVEFSRLLRQYEPALVNEKSDGSYVTKAGVLPGDTSSPLNQRDELITAGGQMMIELQQFIHDHEKLSVAHASLTSDALQAFAFLKKEGISTPSLTEAVESLTARLRQCYDVLETIANANPPDCADLADRFLAGINKIRQQSYPNLEVLQPPEPNGTESPKIPRSGD